MIPEVLKKGDEIRVIAPSRSMSVLNENVVDLAKEKLEELGFKVTFGKNVLNYESEYFKCGKISDRIEDLENAFRDKNVKAILTATGGYNVNQLLDYIDYELIKNNPKIICGFSDITALVNAIYAKTDLITFVGLQFFNFGMKYGIEYSLDYFKKIMMDDDEIKIESSDKWSNDKWQKNQENREFIENKGMQIINEGCATGKIIGGNLCTLNLLQGTEYMPDLDNTILFLEDDGETGKAFIKEFDRNLQSLLHIAKNKKINGIVLGRAEKISEMNKEKWIEIIRTKEKLKKIPIIIDSDIGHTTPSYTFPIGGKANLKAKDGKIELYISKK